MCKSQTGVKTVKYYTKSLSHSYLSLVPTLSTLCFLQQKKKKFPFQASTDQISDPKPPIHSQMPLITGHRSTHRRHSSPTTDPLIGATHHRLHLHRHRRHSLPIQSSPIHWVFFSFFFPLSSIVVGPTVSWPPPPSLIHSFNLSSGFFFPLLLWSFIDLGFWMVYGSWWWLGLWVVVDGWDVLWVLVVAELWVLGG